MHDLLCLSAEQNYQLRFAFIFGLMSHWRQIRKRSLSSNHTLSKKSLRKYTPKKETEIDNSSMFKNQGISKVRDSFIESELMNRSRSIQASSHDIHPVSPKKQHESVVMKRMQTGELEFSKGTKQVESKIKRISTIEYGKNQHLSKELQSLKTEFKKFQVKIMKEIREQEQTLMKMFKQIMQALQVTQKIYVPSQQFQSTSVSQTKIFTPNNLQSTNLDNLSNKIETQMTSLKIKTDEFTPTFKQNATNSNQQVSPRANAYRLGHLFGREKSPKSPPKDGVLFSKFFQAMDSLKKQMKEIGNLSEFVAPLNKFKGSHSPDLKRLEQTQKD